MKNSKFKNGVRIARYSIVKFLFAAMIRRMYGNFPHTTVDNLKTSITESVLGKLSIGILFFI